MVGDAFYLPYLTESEAVMFYDRPDAEASAPFYLKFLKLLGIAGRGPFHADFSGGSRIIE